MKRNTLVRVGTSGAIAVMVAATLFSGSVYAVPAFARQTGMSCSQCHTVFPELTPFGRSFKAGGYTLTATKQISEGGEEGKRPIFEMPAGVPLGVQGIFSYTHTATGQQVSTAAGAPKAKNDDVLFPQEFGFFYAGKIAPKLGAFIQLTYDGTEDHFGIDNADIRFAHTVDVGGKSLIIGATLNNSPTVSDLWHSTPVWGAPFSSSPVAPSPGAATLIEGGLAGAVAGAGIYGFYNGMVYAEFDVFHSAPVGVSRPLDSSTGATQVIDGVIPYWRLAIEKNVGRHSLTLGTFGLTGTLLPGGSYTDTSTMPESQAFHPLVGPGDKFTDVAVDAQYQFIGDHHIASLVATYIHENQTLTASKSFGNADNEANELHSFKVSGSYTWDRLVGGRATLTTMRGSTDATLYGGQGPRSTSMSGELFYTPWLNTKFGLVYTSYLDFNGATDNYDGQGRNASDNNTAFAYLWLAF